jgi:AhpD family alkylhydroperoxidase
VPATTLYLITLRASQINGCSVCIDIHSRELKNAGEPDERILAVAAWREAPYFTDAERAALALTEAATRLADRPDPVPDEVWEEATRHYDEQELAALVLAIAAINAWNRINGATRQIGGEWVASGPTCSPPSRPPDRGRRLTGGDACASGRQSRSHRRQRKDVASQTGALPASRLAPRSRGLREAETASPASAFRLR